MRIVRRIPVAIVAAVALVASVIGGALPARTQEGVVRTATLLPYLAQRVEQGQDGKSFEGEDLAISADARKNPTRLSYVRFSLATLPKGAQITGWTLRLYAPMPPRERQLVRVFPAMFPPGPPPPPLTWSTRPQLAEGARAVGSGEVARAGKVDFELVVPSPTRPWVDLAKGDVALMLQSVTSSLDYVYQGLCNPGGTTAPTCANRQPRLIVRYVLAPAAPDLDWPQWGYDAQQSSRTLWRQSTAVQEVARRQVYAPHGYIVGAPVMAQGRLIVHTQRDDAGSKKFFLTAVDEGGTQVWDVDIQAPAKFPPIQDRRGRLHVVTENNLRIVHVKGGAPSVESRAWTDLLGPGSPSVRARPTVGVNGALYLSTDRGIFALSPYPDLRVWWRSESPGAQFGQVALSPDEATAYVVDGTAGQLVALDNTDGSERWRSGRFDRAAPGAAEPLPVPVVTSLAVAGRPDRLPLVYAVSGHERGTSLQVFEGDRGGTVALASTGFFSRPVSDGSGAATLVRQDQAARGRLCRYRWRPGEAAIQEECQGPEADDLSTLSVLAADGDDRVYVIDGTSSPQKVRGYTRTRALMFALDVPETRSAGDETTTNFGDNVLVGPDGTLYATNRNALFALEPTRLTSPRPDLVLVGPDVRAINRTAFLAEASITVAGDVAIGAVQSIILRGSTIAFTPGFSVSTGAQVLCKTGAAQR